jgi:histidinol-phosphate aminotransferase
VAVADEAAAAGCRLLLDLAYHPLAEVRPDLPRSAWQLWAPNKAHGVTGVRAGYVLAPPTDATHLRAAPSWVVSAHGEAFLGCLPDPDARRWVRDTRRTLWCWRDALAAELRALDLDVEVGVANYLLVHVGDAAATARRLRATGVGVRDATSFGIPTALRLSAQPPAARAALCAALSVA